MRTPALRAVLVALAVLAVACGGTAALHEEDVEGDYRDTRVTTTVAGAATDGTTATTATTVSPLTTRPQGGPRPTSAPGTGFTVVTDPPASADPVYVDSRKRAGLGAGMILQPRPAARIVVEVMEQPDAKANQGALDRVISDLRDFTGKPLEVIRTPLPAGRGDELWTGSSMAEYVDRHAKAVSGNGVWVFHYGFVRGGLRDSDRTLGVAFRADSFFAFPDRAAGFSQKNLTAIYVHETGHLLGLVDLYLQRNRHDTSYDPARSGHSKNPRSVMYYAVNPALNLGTPFDSGVTEFDQEDLKDLAAIRAGAPPGSNPR